MTIDYTKYSALCGMLSGLGILCASSSDFATWGCGLALIAGGAAGNIANAVAAEAHIRLAKVEEPNDE